ncbi:MAG: hypothetical protein ACRD1O_09970 [Terriglobia bacterium]
MSRRSGRDTGERFESSRIGRWLLFAGLGLVLVAGEGVSYIIRERQDTERLVLANSQLERQLSMMRSQVSSLKTNLKELSVPVLPQLPLPANQPWPGVGQFAEASQPAAEAGRRRVAVHRASMESKWQRQMKQELAQQAKQLATTQQDLAQARAALDNGMTSTRSSLSDLDGSIARNHAELVALERLGQRSYFEFDLAKSKRFERAGPLSLSLRHTNAKHKNYNMVLLVDDYQIEKKNVDLYEPISLETAESSQPLELVVNRIGKNTVHGYVSVPKPLTEKAVTSTGLNGVPDTGTGVGVAASSPEPSQSGQVALTRRAQPQL